MLIAIVLIVVTLAAILLLALAWRCACRQRDVPVKPYVFWFPALLGLVAVGLFVSIGVQSGVFRLMHDVHDYRPQAKMLIAGDTLDSIKQKDIPLLGLIHALQSRLMHHPSAAGWQALSKLYTQLTQQAGVDASHLAVQAARRAVVVAPHDATQQVLLAQTLIAANGGALTDEAQQLLEGVLAAHNDYDGARLLLAMAAIRGNNYAVAENAFTQLLAAHPDDKATDLLEKSLDRVRHERQLAEHFAAIKVTITAAAGAHPTTGGTLFVFVKQQGAAGKPLAAKKVLLDKLPMTLTLTAADWLGAFPAIGTKLTVGARYAVGAGANVAASKPFASVPLSVQDDALTAKLLMP